MDSGPRTDIVTTRPVRALSTALVADAGSTVVDLDLADTPPVVRSSKKAIVLAVIAYSLLSLLAYHPILPLDNSRLPTCACGDLEQGVWFLRWTSFAMLHGHNPFLSDYMGYPSGVNIAQNTSMPLLGILSSPITWTIGPVASLNALLWLAYPASATACFVTVRRWVSWTPAAFMGGLLYGFSPYVLAQGISHLNLIFVPVPPLILYVLDELVVRQRKSSRKYGIALGLLLAAQYLISTEIFASTVAVAGLGVLLLMALHPRAVRDHAVHAMTGIGWALLMCGAIVAYPLYLAVAGPDRLANVAAHVYSNSADLLSSVVPSINQRFAPAAWLTLGNQFAVGNPAEIDGYLGIPLVVLLLAAVVRFRRHGVVIFSGLMMLLAEILSLGPRLTVDLRPTQVPLLMADLDRLPILSNFVDSRFALYTDLFAAIVLAVSAEQLWRTLRTRSARRRLVVGRHRRPGSLRWPGLVIVVVLIAALIPLVPRWPARSYAVSVPSLFSKGDLKQVPAGSVALTYPYPYYPNLSAMVWQAAASMRFRIIGGYALVPGTRGQPIYKLFPTYLPSVPSTLVADYEGDSPHTVNAGATKATSTQVRAFLAHYKVQTVFSKSVGASPRAADALFIAALGPPSTRVGPVDVWYDVRKKVDGLSHSS